MASTTGTGSTPAATATTSDGRHDRQHADTSVANGAPLTGGRDHDEQRQALEREDHGPLHVPGGRDDHEHQQHDHQDEHGAVPELGPLAAGGVAHG